MIDYMNWTFGTFFYLLTSFVIYHKYNNYLEENYVNARCVRATELKCNFYDCCFKYHLTNNPKIYSYTCYPLNQKDILKDIYFFECYYDIKMPDELIIGYLSTDIYLLLTTLIYLLFSIYRINKLFV